MHGYHAADMHLFYAYAKNRFSHDVAHIGINNLIAHSIDEA